MNRGGFTLPELLTALTLTGIVAGALFASVQSQTRLMRRTIEQTSRADALRMATLVVGAETRAIAPRDIRAVGPDSLTARWFRGTAIVCGYAAGLAHVRYHGMRQPDPAKDSILIADADEVLGLAAVLSSTQSCGGMPGTVSLALRLTGRTLLPGTLLLIFETGTYHVSTRALRFRYGNEGRQPITEELLDDRWSGFSSTASGFQARFVLRGNQRSGDPLETAVIVFPLLNQ